MVETYIKEIEERLQKIQKENEENINQLINIETSNRYCIGSLLYSYGKVYNIIFNSENYEQAIRGLEKIRLNEDYEHIDEEIQHFENLLINDLKKGRHYWDSQLDLETILEHDHILNIMLKQL